MFNPLFLLVAITNVQQVHMFVSLISFLFNNLALLMFKWSNVQSITEINFHLKHDLWPAMEYKTKLKF